METVPVESTWTSGALEVVRRACEYFGGTENWRALRRIHLVPGELSGLVPWLKGVGRTFPLPSGFEIEPHERRARFLNYPEASQDGVFHDGVVSLESRETREVLVKSDNHRQSFVGLGKNRRWAPLDALYLFWLRVDALSHIAIQSFRGTIMRNFHDSRP